MRFKYKKYTLFFISNTFINNTRLKLAKNQAKAKQRPEAEVLLFENCSLSSLRNVRKNKCACFNEIMWLIIMKMKLKISGYHRYDINRTNPRREQYDMAMRNKQHLSNIWSWIHGKVKKKSRKKRCLYKKIAYISKFKISKFKIAFISASSKKHFLLLNIQISINKGF